MTHNTDNFVFNRMIDHSQRILFFKQKLKMTNFKINHFLQKKRKITQ